MDPISSHGRAFKALLYLYLCLYQLSGLRRLSGLHQVLDHAGVITAHHPAREPLCSRHLGQRTGALW